MPPEPTTGGSQPHVRDSIVLARMVGVGAWSIGMAVYLTAWASGSAAWHIGFAVLYTAILGVVFVVAGMPRRLQHDADISMARELHELAVRDELTGLYNRRFFNQELERAVMRSEASGEPLTLAIIDLDDFKQVNDSFGHQAGDVALKVVAECLNASVSGSAVTARIGGDEFAIILPGTTGGEGLAIASEIRRTLSATPMLFNGEHPGCARLQAAFGIVQRREGTPAEAVLIQADKALYADKGRPARRVGALIAS